MHFTRRLYPISAAKSHLIPYYSFNVFHSSRPHSTIHPTRNNDSGSTEKGDDEDSTSSGSEYRRRRSLPFHQMMTNYIPPLQMSSEIQQVFSNVTKSKRTPGGRKECQKLMEMFSYREEAFRLRRAEEIAAKKRGDKYREPPLKELLITYNEPVSQAYVFDRFFENYGLLYNIFRQAQKRIPGFHPRRIFDFGTGPGTALWAAKSVFTELERAIGCDVSEPMLSMAQEFSQVSEFEYKTVELQRYLSFPDKLAKEDQDDIVVCAFSLQDLQNEAERYRVLSALWKRTRGILVLVERGDPLGFDRILKARRWIVENASVGRQGDENVPSIVAPCPHAMECPIANEKFTCHFSQTVEYPIYLHLTDEGRQGATRTPTASFVIFSKNPLPNHETPQKRLRDKNIHENANNMHDLESISTQEEAAAMASSWPRIIHPPSKEKGHTLLNVCTPNGTYERWVSSRKKDGKNIYKDSRRAKRGDLWPFDSAAEKVDKFLQRGSRQTLKDDGMNPGPNPKC